MIKFSLLCVLVLGAVLFCQAANPAQQDTITIYHDGVPRNISLGDFVSFLSTTEASMDFAPASVLNSLDTFWLLFGACLVFLMQAGFAMLEVGSVSIKNTKNILVKNMFDATFGAMSFWALGYGFALGKGGGFIGGANFFLQGDEFSGAGAGFMYATWLFQFAFAATAATIVSGAVAERVAFGCYIVYTTLLTMFIYPVVVHWAWSPDGWASAAKVQASDLFLGVGVLDFAGSGVVHMTGGTAALCAAVFVGPRLGRFNADGTLNDFPQQSPVFQTLGTIILWFGWYGFNCASTLAISGSASSVAAKVAVTTTISAAAGGLTTLLTTYGRFHILDPGVLNNGLLAGLVGITSSCATVAVEGAFFIGVISGVVYMGVSAALKRFHIDDVVDAVPVHLGCGMWGVLAAGLFSTQSGYKLAFRDSGAATPCGLFYGCGAAQLGANFVFVLAVLAWVGGTCCLMFLGCKYTVGLRVCREVELRGMDVSKHGGAAYPEFGRSQEETARSSTTGGGLFLKSARTGQKVRAVQAQDVQLADLEENIHPPGVV